MRITDPPYGMRRLPVSYISTELHDKLRFLAQANGEPLKSVVIKALEQYAELHLTEERSR